MRSPARHLWALGFALALIPRDAQAQSHADPRRQQPQTQSQTQAQQVPLPVARPEAAPVHAESAPARDAVPVAAPTSLLATVSFAEIGYSDGIRFANLAGRRDVFMPLPEGGETVPSALMLAVDDISAHPAKRSLEVLVNDRSALAVPLDGHGQGRILRIPLANARPKDGYLKLSFLYSGAATPDRCIDMRYVGDSLTIRPESAVEVDLVSPLDIATTATLMPRDVALVLPGRRRSPSDLATALTIARALIASGRRVAFYQEIPAPAKRNDERHWKLGLIVVGPMQEVAGLADPAPARLAGPLPALGLLSAARVAGTPALLVSEGGAERAGQLLASRSLAAIRGIPSASVGEVASISLPNDRVTFDQLGIPPAQAEVFGRADLAAVLDTRRLPSSTRPSRLLLDILVAPDGAGEKAVVSVYVNDRLLASSVAASGEPTRFDIGLPDDLIGTHANIRAVVQRRSAQGDCRFEPQGYPAQILGGSSVVLARVSGNPSDFSDLAAHWAGGMEVWLPESVVERPTAVLDLTAKILAGLSFDAAPIKVKLASSGIAAAPSGPFLAVSDSPPQGASPRARFDGGRVAVEDRSGRMLLDLGGFASGAVVQVVTAGQHPGMWIKPLSADGVLPAPSQSRLEHGDVAFIDHSGVALAMSTSRDTLIRISYPDQPSWFTVAERFRPWIVGGLWLLATLAFVLALQRMLHRRRVAAADE